MSAVHTYLGIFCVDPLGIIAVVPEQTLAVRCWMTFSAVRAACQMRARLVCSSGRDGRLGFEVALTKSARMTMGFQLMRAGAVAAVQLGCFAPSDCVAPMPASLTEGSTSIGSCSVYIAAASAEKERLVNNASGMGPSLGVPDVDVHLGDSTHIGVAYNAGFRSVLEVLGQGGSYNSSFHLSNSGFDLVKKVQIVQNVDDLHERRRGGETNPVLQPRW